MVLLNKKVVIFDLDGTLIDSIQDIGLCTNLVLERLGQKTHPLDAYQNFVGDGALMLLQNALPLNIDKITLNKALLLFKEVYGDSIHKNTKPYDGIYEMLNILNSSDLKLAILSNKPHEFTVKFIDYFFKDISFHEVHGQKDGVPKKPNPMGIYNISNALNISTNEIIFVGDTPTDIKTAKNAKITSIGVSWGYRNIEELVLAKADFIAKSPEHLTKLILENNFS
ncbi:MAG: phosphoglycolate phosphatase [Arcobacteraceae bacterium]|jgi:phosphoglycolate phosphatase